MKKLILLLLSFISVVGYSQTYPTTHAENTKFTGIVRFDQPVRQNGTDTLATKKYARGLISMPDTVTKVATKYDVSKKLDINGNGSQLTGITKTQVGLSNVDNTSDTNKPISAATQAALNAKQNTLGFTPEDASMKNEPSGYAGLDINGKVPETLMPASVLGTMKYMGTWDASAGAYPASPKQGYYYVASAAGTISSKSYKIGDWMVFNGSSWDRIDNQNAVTSVVGKVGAVTLTTDDITEGTNQFYTDTRARAALSLTTSGNSGAATYSGGVFNIPNYTLEGLGGVGSVSINPEGSTALYTRSDRTGTASSLTVGVSSGYTIPTTTAVNNAATAYGWGNHASAGYLTTTTAASTYTPLTGTGASGTWGINITGNAANATTWNGKRGNLSTRWTTGDQMPMWDSANNEFRYGLVSDVQSWLGLGSMAYGSVSGSSGYIPKFTSGNTIGNSPIYTDGTKVGIGTTSPLSDLQIEGKYPDVSVLYAYNYNVAGSSRGLQIEAGGNTSDYSASFADRTGNSLMIIRGNGNVGINTTSPAAKLDVSGNANFSGAISASSVSISGGSPSSGKVLTATDANGNSTWQTPAVDWANVTSKPTLNTFLPSQSGNSGKVLATDGSNASWQTPSVYANNVNPVTYNVSGSFNLADNTAYPPGSVIYVYSSSDVTVQLGINAGGVVESWLEGQTKTVCRAGTGNVTFAPPTQGSIPISSINGYTKIGDKNTMVAVTLHYDGSGNPHFFLVGNLSN